MSAGHHIAVDVPPGVRWDAAIRKSVHESLPYYVENFSSASFSDSGVGIETLSPPADHAKITSAVSDLIVTISNSHRDIADRVITVSDHPARLVEADPFAHFVQCGDIVSTGRGKFIYAGGFLRVFEALDRTLLAFAETLGARKELYPSTVRTQSLLDSGYLKQSPHLAFFVAPAHADKNALLALADASILSRESREQTLKQLGVPDQILSPTVCYHCFEARKGGVQKPGIVTAINKCYRHEPVDVQGLERLTTYWMREIIVFGTPEDVNRILGEVCDFTMGLLENLGCQYDLTTASDPFFTDMAAGKRMFQAAFDLKRELKSKAYGGKDISIASFNNHQKSLVQSFGIQSPGMENFASGCIGFGMERMLYCIFSQLGPDTAKWPEGARKALGLS